MGGATWCVLVRCAAGANGRTGEDEKESACYSEERKPTVSGCLRMGLIIRSSAIHAAGCYTTTAVARDTRLVEYTGPRLSKDAADKLYSQKPYTYLFGVGDGTTVIDGHGIAMFINHSCDPNCETEEDDDGRVWIRSIRDIAAGEELTYDYCLYDGDGDEPCFCGAASCRGTMYSPEEVKRRKRAEARKKAAAEKQKSTRSAG
jgi:SET domain-containing protein